VAGSEKGDVSQNWYVSAPMLALATSIKGKSVLARAIRETWTAGATIIDQLEQSNDVYFIISGQCRAVFYTQNGIAVGFRHMEPGEHFGELGVLTGATRASAVVAETDVILAKIQADAFLELLKAEPEISLKLMATLATSVQSLSARIIEFSTLPVRDRILSEFARMAPSSLEPLQQAIDLKMVTHERLASLVGVNRETVTRELRSMRQDGLIEYDRRRLKLIKAPRVSINFEAMV
jgi:CRP/FNR family transcriptional regulator, cyclic AMP receptor protein